MTSSISVVSNVAIATSTSVCCVTFCYASGISYLGSVLVGNLRNRSCVEVTANFTSCSVLTFCCAGRSFCFYGVVAVTSSILVVSNISVTTSRTFVGCVTHSCASGLFFVYYYIAMTCCRNYIRCICVSAVFTSVIGVSFCSTGRLNSNKVVLVACHRYICNLFVTTHRALLCYRTHLVAGCIYGPNFLIVVGNGACGVLCNYLLATLALTNCCFGCCTGRGDNCSLGKVVEVHGACFSAGCVLVFAVSVHKAVFKAGNLNSCTTIFANSCAGNHEREVDKLNRILCYDVVGERGIHNCKSENTLSLFSKCYCIRSKFGSDRINNVILSIFNRGKNIGIVLDIKACKCETGIFCDHYTYVNGITGGNHAKTVLGQCAAVGGNHNGYGNLTGCAGGANRQHTKYHKCNNQNDS